MKDEKDAIPELVKYQLRKTQSELNKRNLDDDKNIDAEISNIKDAEDNIDEDVENEEIEKVGSIQSNFITGTLDQKSIKTMINLFENRTFVHYQVHKKI